VRRLLTDVRDRGAPRTRQLLALYVLVVGIAAGYVVVSGLVHGGNVMWTLFGAVVAAMAAMVLWMVGHSAIQARRWLLARRP